MEQLRSTIEATPCIGTIARQGKDAAGKALESEYYYMPEHDEDEQRRAAVVDGLRKPSLRNCRKQHKVRITRAWPPLGSPVMLTAPRSNTTGSVQRRRRKPPSRYQPIGTRNSVWALMSVYPCCCQWSGLSFAVHTHFLWERRSWKGLMHWGVFGGILHELWRLDFFPPHSQGGIC
jgi:hypothetical protein